MRTLRPTSNARLLALLVLALAGPLAGCSNVDRAVATSPIPDDFHLRHPIALTNARQTLEVFLVGPTIDERQRRDLAIFGVDFRANGQGRVQALLPEGAVDARRVDATLTAIRRALVKAGVSGDMEVGSYPVADPRLAATIRLSFVKLQAKPTTKCGEWPQDLASASSLEGCKNYAYGWWRC